MPAKNKLMTFKVDGMLGSNIGENGITAEFIAATNAQNSPLYKSLNSQLSSHEMPCAQLASEFKTLSLCREVWEKYKQRTKHIISVGIGGADSIPKMVYDAFGKYNTDSDIPTFEFVGSETDSAKIEALDQKLEGHEEDTTIVVFCKSGTTMEPTSVYYHLKEHMKKKFGDAWKKHFIMATDGEKGDLIKEVRREGLTNIPTSDVGDRFAPLSVLGLLPATILGIDAEAMMKGARDAFSQMAAALQEDNIAWNIALYQKMFYELFGTSAAVSMIYLSRLSEFNNWLRQLWSESLGKEGKGVAILPYSGPGSQHYFLQFMLGGPKHFCTSLIMTQKKSDTATPIVTKHEEGASFLLDKTFDDLTEQSAENTLTTLKAKGRPAARLELDSFNEETFGSLIAMSEMAVIYLGNLLGLKNVFDQPEVALSRELIDKSMGRPQ